MRDGPQKKEVWDGPWDEEFKDGTDYDWFLKCPDYDYLDDGPGNDENEDRLDSNVFKTVHLKKQTLGAQHRRWDNNYEADYNSKTWFCQVKIKTNLIINTKNN